MRERKDNDMLDIIGKVEKGESHRPINGRWRGRKESSMFGMVGKRTSARRATCNQIIEATVVL
jgi:hypothetical protein